MNLTGKRVLFIAPMFFGYEKLIKTKLEDRGAHVDYFNDRPDNNFLTKALIRVDRRLLSIKTNKYYDKLIKDTAATNYDHILIVRGEAISIERLRKLKKAQPHAKLKLYLWDSMHYNPNARLILQEFNQAFSFDRTDVKSHEKLKFLPLFYGDEFNRAASYKASHRYDSCFIGTIHTDRYKVLEKVVSGMESKGYNVFVYCYYPSKLMYYIRSIFNPGFRRFTKKHINFSGMTLTQVVEKISESRSVIDINRPDQRGLTMRSIEAVGAQKRLITTNNDIKNYDIYSENSVLLVDRKNPVINEDFIHKKDNTPFSCDLREKYSINTWINSVFCFDQQ